MKKFLHSVIIMIAALLTSTAAMADGIHIGYCDGVIATASTGTVTGMTGSNAEIQGAIFVTPDMLKAYSSCQITSLYVGMAENAAAYPTKLTGWVRTAKEGENITSGTMTPMGGWNTIQLDKAIDVKDYTETGLWIGFSYVQTKKLSVLALLKGEEEIENSGWIAKKGTWTNYSSKGILPIEAIVEGEGLPQRDLTIMSAVAFPSIIKIGGSIEAKVTVKNNALTSAVNPVINYSIANGAIKGSYTIEQTLNYRDKATVAISIPADAITEEMETTADLTLAWADGQKDDNEVDNAASFPLTFSKDVFYKKMLCEEATGSWCGWCVRGLVGLKTMREMYPNQFIGIGVHNSDEYTVKAYDSWMSTNISGYPSCLVNRDGTVYDPGYDVLDPLMQAMNPVAEAGLEVSGEVKDGQLTMNCKTTFGASMEGKTYNIVYVVVEDSLPISQHNYYSGGSYGEMGGFESLSNPTDIYIDDVSRGVFPSPAGELIDTPSSIKKGDSYSHTLTATMPTIVNEDKTFLVAFVIDNATGQVVNAEKGNITFPESTGIQSVHSSEFIGHSYYNMAGQKVSSDFKGVVINNGKKYVK